jgi:hypothetical protein
MAPTKSDTVSLDVTVVVDAASQSMITQSTVESAVADVLPNIAKTDIHNYNVVFTPYSASVSSLETARRRLMTAFGRKLAITVTGTATMVIRVSLSTVGYDSAGALEDAVSTDLTDSVADGSLTKALLKSCGKCEMDAAAASSTLAYAYPTLSPTSPVAASGASGSGTGVTSASAGIIGGVAAVFMIMVISAVYYRYGSGSKAPANITSFFDNIITERASDDQFGRSSDDSHNGSFSDNSMVAPPPRVRTRSSLDHHQFFSALPASLSNSRSPKTKNVESSRTTSRDSNDSSPERNSASKLERINNRIRNSIAEKELRRGSSGDNTPARISTEAAVTENFLAETLARNNDVAVSPRKFSIMGSSSNLPSSPVHLVDILSEPKEVPFIQQAAQHDAQLDDGYDSDDLEHALNEIKDLHNSCTLKHVGDNIMIL